MKRFKNKTALITGGGGDMGLASCKRLLKEGANVVITDFSDEKLQNAIYEMNKLGYHDDRVKAVQGDVRSLKDCNTVTEFVIKEFGSIDILITTAGIIKHAPIDDLTEDDWKDVIEINLTGTFNFAKAVVKYMKKQKNGRMVLISSIGGRTGRPSIGANYAASKAGIVGLTQLLAYELGSWNITVNSVAPGPLNGTMVQNLSKNDIEKLKSNLRISRLGELSEIAAAIAYLASDEAGWTTGEVLDVNGGSQY